MKVLVTSRSFGKEAPEEIQRLEDAGISLVRAPKPNPSPEELAAQIAGFDALIVGNDVVDESVFEAASNLRIVHMNGTGLDDIDIDAATRHGVLVSGAPGANRNAVAELTVGLMLDVARSIHRYASALDAGTWERSRGVELTGKTVGVLGLGNIGRRVIELLRGFDIHAMGFDAFPPDEWTSSHNVELCDSMDEIFQRSDFLVLALPLTDQTRHVVNESALDLMKQTAFLINTARGGLVDTDALCRAIHDHKIAGAALDAFEREPLPPNSPLRNIGLILTPHLAASSKEASAEVTRTVVDHVIDALIFSGTGNAVNATGAVIARDKN